MIARHKLAFAEIKKCRKCRKMANLAIPSTFRLKKETWRGPPSKVSPPPRVMLYAVDRRKNKSRDASSQENQAIAKFYLENENASRPTNKCRHFSLKLPNFSKCWPTMSPSRAQSAPRLRTTLRFKPEVNASRLTLKIRL